MEDFFKHKFPINDARETLQRNPESTVALKDEIARLTKQRDELVAALEHVVEYWNGDNNETAMHDALTHIDDVAREALASVKGGA